MRLRTTSWVALAALVAACANTETSITVGVYSSLPFGTDAMIRGVCLVVESRGRPPQRVIVPAPTGVPPRWLFDFRIVPLDDDLSQPITVTVSGRTRVGCSLGTELARRSRVTRFIPGDAIRETFELADVDPETPPPDAGVDAALDVPAVRPDVPVVRPDGPDLCGGCPTGQACCNRACVVTRFDPTNCGACGMACGEGQFCVNGGCVCPAGQFLCDGRRCTDPRFDPDACGPGTCGGRCAEVANGRRACSDGRCVYTCNDGFEPLGGRCVRCGFAGDPACNRPMPCNAGLTNCGGACRDLATDRTNCGACDVTCAASRPCVGARCS